MRITGVELPDLHAITDEVSHEAYEGNVIVSPDAHSSGSNTLTARLRVRDSYGAGARTSASGRHGPYACWHAYRDVLRALFLGHPGAVVRTVLATYTGLPGFECDYPDTRYRNVGSVAQPAFLPELCVRDDCRDAVPVSFRELAELTDLEVPDSLPDSAAVAARMASELRLAEQSDPEPLVFTGPLSLLGAPDLAYSGR